MSSDEGPNEQNEAMEFLIYCSCSLPEVISYTTYSFQPCLSSPPVSCFDSSFEKAHAARRLAV